MNIIAVVVTYNRMELLKRNIRCLQQNKPISSIVIVNNGSTDGTTAVSYTHLTLPTNREV